MNNQSNDAPVKTTSPPRLGFIVIFAISTFFQIVLGVMSINDGYFPTQKILESIPQDDWYWTANRIVMPSFIVTGIISLFTIIGVYMRQYTCLLYTSPSPRDKRQSRMPSSA